MTIDLSQIKENSMVRYGFKILLMREFDIHINETDVGRLIAADGKRIIRSYVQKHIFWIIGFAEIFKERCGIFLDSDMKKNV